MTCPELAPNYRVARETSGRSLHGGWPLTVWILSNGFRWRPIVSTSRSTVNPEVAGSNPVEPAKQAKQEQGVGGGVRQPLARLCARTVYDGAARRNAGTTLVMAIVTSAGAQHQREEEPRTRVERARPRRGRRDALLAREARSQRGASAARAARPLPRRPDYRRAKASVRATKPLSSDLVLAANFRLAESPMCHSQQPLIRDWVRVSRARFGAS